MKTIVTHFTPDIDSLTSIWLIKKFLPKWESAKIEYVGAGSTLDKAPPDTNPDIIHVDTGMGQFDHHQANKYNCAATLVLDYLIKKNLIKDRYLEALKRMVLQVNDFDHFAESKFPEADNDRYEFMLHKIIEGGLKAELQNDSLITETVFSLLNAVFNIFLKKVWAEEEIKKGISFESKMGKTLVIESKNEETIKLALKMGFVLVAKKDPDRGFIRIKTLPDPKYDLLKLYEKIIKVDKEATWFLHISHNMLLNSSSKNPHFIPSKLSTNRLIEIIKSV